MGIAAMGDAVPGDLEVATRTVHALLAVYGLILLAGIPVLLRYLAHHGVRSVFSWYPLAWLKTRPWDVRDAFFILALLLTLSMLFWTLYGQLAVEGTSREGGIAAVVILQSVLFHWMGLLLVVFQARGRGYRLRDALGVMKLNVPLALRKGGLILLGILPVVMVGHSLFFSMLMWLEVPLETQEMVRVLAEARGVGLRLYLALLAVVVAPLTEEVLFRGVLLPALCKWMSPLLAVVLSSLLFAAFHMHLGNFMALFLLSLGLSLAYAHTRSLAVPVAMHALFNAVPVVVLMVFPV